MHSIVTRPCGKTRTVKNLGWLRRHAGEVETLYLTNREDGSRCGCVLTARLEDGTTYQTPFNSTMVCREWIKRPCLRHALVRDEVTLFSFRNP